MIVTALYGGPGVGALLVLSQAILSLQLSVAVIPLVHFTGQASKMGELVNRRATAALARSVAILILALSA